MGDHLAIARNPAVAFRQVCAIRSSDHGQKHMIGTAACWLPTDNANAGFTTMPMLALGTTMPMLALAFCLKASGLLDILS